MKFINLKLGMIQTNCYIVFDEESLEAVVIDPADEAQRIIKTLEDNNLNLKYILLTHGHFDHILATSDLLAKYSTAKLVIHNLEKNYLKFDIVTMFHPSLATVYKELTADILVEDGDSINFGNLTATYILTPGHTTGSSVIKIGDVLFTGDTLFRGNCGRCDLYGGDFNVMLKSLKKLYLLEGEFTVCPGHDAFSTMSWERSNNEYMRMALNQ